MIDVDCCALYKHRSFLGFFDDILIPSTKLQHPSRFIETEQTWAWQYETDNETHDLVMDIGEEIR
jgi:DNA-directed RNA polymerase III subunit RPC8